MKKYLSFAIAALSLLSFISCEKQEAIDTTPSFDGTFVFTSSKPEILDEVATKTGWNGSSVQWLKGDNIRMAFKVDGEWQSSGKVYDDGTSDESIRLYASTPLGADADIASFVVPTDFQTNYSGYSESTFDFYAIYPSKAVSGTAFNDAPSTKMSIPAEQKPKADSFDALADILVGNASTTGMPEDPILMNWNRVVALGQITLKNLTVYAGETLQSVTFTAQEGADLVGSHTINLVDGSVSNPTGTNNVITVDASGLSIASDNTLKVWIGLLPTEITSLTIAIETNSAIYTRVITGISKTFVKNKRNILGINMSTATRVAKEVNVESYPYSESFASSLGKFDIDNISKPDELSYVWAYNSSKYAKASAYVNSTNYATESLLISPYIDMSGSVNPELSFKHTSKFFTNIQSETAVLIRKKGTTEWSTLTIDKYPTNDNWTFVDAKASLAAYKNDVIQIAFKYTSTDEAAGTWEIKNFSVDESTGNATTVTIKSTHTGSAVQDLESVTESAGDITAVFSKNGAATGIYESTGQIRVYVGNTITLTGGTIKKVVITCSGDSYNKGFTANSGSAISSGATWTWTGSSSSLVLTADGTSRITSIDVTYE